MESEEKEDEPEDAEDVSLEGAAVVSFSETEMKEEDEEMKEPLNLKVTAWIFVFLAIIHVFNYYLIVFKLNLIWLF